MESLDDLPDESQGITPALLRDWREIPLEALERREVRSLIQAAVEELPDIYRQVFPFPKYGGAKRQRDSGGTEHQRPGG